ncbi:hypothetical protein HMSSN139_23900 [Paenibacillus sp. HMSSN-139]|nr:hypothetical protein HMSSN139_23900 [Paenibacillus sp. HMSSN-139]
MKRKNRWYLLGLLPFVVMVALFQLVPIVSMVTGSVRPEDGAGITFGYYARIFKAIIILKPFRTVC